MSNPILHFEIPADDLDRARKFYTSIFGWKISDPWKMQYFMVETRDHHGDGINGGMMKRKAPGQPFTNYIAVDEINDILAQVTAGGGMLAMPKTEIGPGMGWIAAFKDPEGNIMGLHQEPDSAKQPVKKPAPNAAKKAAAKSSTKTAAKPAAKKAAPKAVKKAAPKKPAKNTKRK
ncbi:MAG: VOC family protein [Rhodospirillaceae bacterium]